MIMHIGEIVYILQKIHMNKQSPSSLNVLYISNSVVYNKMIGYLAYSECCNRSVARALFEMNQFPYCTHFSCYTTPSNNEYLCICI